MAIFLVFFLWDTIFADPSRIVFGYDRARILTYVFGVIILRSIVLSVRSIDIPGEISRGDITNYFLKPVNYFKYWLTRDISSKALNIVFAIFEFTFLYLLLKPEFFFQTNFLYLLLFLAALSLAVLIYFLLILLFGSPTFWIPEQGWGLIFLLFILTDLLGGGTFPIDILPSSVQQSLYATPFPYLIYIPLQIYLGKLTTFESMKFVVFAFLWVVVLAFLVKYAWRRGLAAYRAEGR